MMDWWNEPMKLQALHDFICPNCKKQGCVEVVGFTKPDFGEGKEIRFCNNCRVKLVGDIIKES